VVRALAYRWFLGSDIVIPYGLHVTDADLVMEGGVRLEKEGVLPDERILPTAADLAARRDPVMARALEMAGRRTDPVTAGRLLPEDERRP